MKALLLAILITNASAQDYAIYEHSPAPVPNSIRNDGARVPLKAIIQDVLNSASLNEVKKARWDAPDLILVQWQKSAFRTNGIDGIGNWNESTRGALNEYAYCYAWCYFTFNIVDHKLSIRNVSICLMKRHDWTEAEIRRVLAYELEIALYALANRGDTLPR